jgi:hypothetical protein
VGYNGRVFFAVGYNGEGFPALWDTTEEDFFRCWIQRRTISGWQKILLYCIPQCRKFFFRCILYLNRIFCSVLYPRKIFSIVSHNAAGFLPLYPTMEDIFLVVGYNGRGFFSLWDTTEETFLHCGIQRKRFFPLWDICNGRGFFPLWDTMEKNIQRRMIFLNFKCFSFPSNKNFGKISYLNSQTNPWKELKMENYMVNHEKKIFFHCGIQRSRDFFNF